MDGQLIAVIGVVIVATIYIVRSTWKAWTGEKACGSGCGGCGAPVPKDEEKSGRISLPQVKG